MHAIKFDKRIISAQNADAVELATVHYIAMKTNSELATTHEEAAATLAAAGWTHSLTRKKKHQWKPGPWTSAQEQDRWRIVEDPTPCLEGITLDGAGGGTFHHGIYSTWHLLDGNTTVKTSTWLGEVIGECIRLSALFPADYVSPYAYRLDSWDGGSSSGQFQGFFPTLGDALRHGSASTPCDEAWADIRVARFTGPPSWDGWETSDADKTEDLYFCRH